MNCKFNRNNSESTRIYRKGSYNPKCIFWPFLRFYLIIWVLYHIGYIIWPGWNFGPELYFGFGTKLRIQNPWKRTKTVFWRHLDQKCNFEENYTLFLSKNYDHVSKFSFGPLSNISKAQFWFKLEVKLWTKLHLRSKSNSWYWTPRISTRGILPNFQKSGPEWTAWDRKFTLEIHYIRYCSSDRFDVECK